MGIFSSRRKRDQEAEHLARDTGSDRRAGGSAIVGAPGDETEHLAEDVGLTGQEFRDAAQDPDPPRLPPVQQPPQ